VEGAAGFFGDGEEGTVRFLPPFLLSVLDVQPDYSMSLRLKSGGKISSLAALCPTPALSGFCHFF
jgi:hypothetical protein